MDMVWLIFFMFGGVAVMMFGMKIMGSALEQVAGSGMKKLLGKITTNRMAGVGVGIAVTSIIQSSTATTVMLVGFVNIGLMTLAQAVNVIMGANIGTTVTAHIVSLSTIGEIDIGAIAAMVGCVGVLMSMLVKNERVANIGNILGGLGLIFVGLEVISSNAKSIMILDNGQPAEWVKTIFMANHNPILLIVIGVVLTALVHSSSTITSLMVALAGIGVLPFENGLFLALGSNIGTCITAVMASSGANVNAKRTAVVHLMFNTFGCLVILAPIWIFKTQIGNLFASMSPNAGQQIAIFHTLFNIIVTIVLLPFTNYIVKLVCLLVKDKKKTKQEKTDFTFIDERMLLTPAVATGNIRREIVKMSEIAKENINLSMNMLLDESSNNESAIRENESKINSLNRGIIAFMTKLVGKDLSIEDDKKISSYFHVVSDIERVGDYAENIMEYALRLRKEELNFSNNAKSELLSMLDAVNRNIKVSVKAFDERNISLLQEVDEVEQEIDNLSQQLELKHIERVKKGSCTAQVGSVYLQTVSNLERVGDHITNLAFSIKRYAK